jgi:hypothetical protein
VRYFPAGDGNLGCGDAEGNGYGLPWFDGRGFGDQPEYPDENPTQQTVCVKDALIGGAKKGRWNHWKGKRLQGTSRLRIAD